MGCHKTSFWISASLIMAVLAWIFEVYPWQWWTRQDCISPVHPVSYDGRILFNLENMYLPHSVDYIKQIVEDARDNNKKIRVLADGHSWSKIAQTQDVMISLAEYTGMVTHNTEELTATFRAGTPLRSISVALDEVGLAMIQLGSVAGQSIAGAISTGTHGTGRNIGNMATLVTKLKLVDGNGNIVELKEGDSDFEAARLNIGLFGVISEVTFRVKAKYNLKENQTLYTLDHCIENLPQFADSAEYVKMWVDFYNNYCILFQTQVTSESPSDPPSKLKSFLTYYTFAVSTRITYLFPFLTRIFMWLVDHIGFPSPQERVDNSYLILNDYFELPVHQEGEVLVDYQYSQDVVRTIRDLVLQEGYPVNYITEVRFVAGDHIWLSPSYDRPNGICAVTLTIYATPAIAHKYFSGVYEATKKFNARFHWGKHFYAKRQELNGLYPKLNDFAKVRQKYDPNGIFINTFLEETFEFSNDN